jgi:glycosyltransferase involved in cell wall biosynthesis
MGNLSPVSVSADRRLRVLWLTQIPPAPLAAAAGAAAQPGPAAWVGSLAARIGAADAIDLTVAAPLAGTSVAVTTGGVTYVGLPTAASAGTKTAADRTTAPIRLARRASAVHRRWSGDHDEGAQVRAAACLARRIDADVIHVHGTESALGLVALGPDAARVVVSLQGILTTYERSYFEGMSCAEVLRLATQSEHLHGWGLLHDHRDMRRRARRERAVLARVGHVMGRTAWDRGVAGILAPQARYHHCGEVLRPIFYATRWDALRQAAGPVVFTTGSDLPWKGIEVLLAAVKLLRGRHPSLRARIAGVPPDGGLQRLLSARARREGVESCVEWLGRVDAGRLAEELAACDVFAYPSRADNSPNALCEAQLVGAPCVAAFAGGIPSLVDDGISGDLVPPGDHLALAAAVDRLLDDRERAAALGERAAAAARVRHDPDAVVAQALAAYQEIAAGARR